MLRFWTGLILLLFFCSLIPAEAMASTEPQIMGEAALLMDLQNGQVLYSKNADRHMYPASTTKILTAIIALEKGHLNDIVTVPREATTVGGSAIGLQAGERLTLHDLLYAMLLASANDAAVTIADHIAGSVPAFAALMNEKARQIGARESHFVNPDGMPDLGLSSATTLLMEDRARHLRFVSQRFARLSPGYSSRPIAGRGKAHRGCGSLVSHGV